MSQRELADILNKSQNLIYTIENGKTDPGVFVIKQVFDVLELDYNVIWKVLEGKQIVIG